MKQVNVTIAGGGISPSMVFTSRSMMLVATIGIGVSGALAGGFSELVVIGSGAIGREQQLASLMVTGVAAVALAITRREAPVVLVAIAWFAAAASDSIVLVGPDRSLTGSVATAECVVVGMALWSSTARFAEQRKVTRAALGCACIALLLFGFAHLTRVDDISSLLPAGTPAGAALPLLSGSLLIACGVGTAWVRTRPVALLLASLMFVSWIPIVHFPRILLRPSSPFEWQFVSLALALAGAFLAIAVTSTPSRLLPIATRARTVAL